MAVGIDHVDTNKSLLISKVFIVNFFTPVGGLFLVFFIPASLLSGSYGVAIVHSLILVALIANWLIFQKTKDTNVASHILVSFGIPALIPFLITGGPENIGYIWTVAYIIWVFFLLSLRGALFWLSLFFLISLAVVLMSVAGAITIPYTIPFLLQLTFLCALTSLLILFFNRANELYRNLLRVQTQNLEKSEARFRYITDSSSDAVIMANSDGRLIAWNRGAELIFGYTEKEAFGKSITELMPEKYRGQSKVIGKTLQLEGMRKTGTVFPMELFIATWKEGKNEIFGAILRDITERKKLEAEYLQSQKLESLGQLVSAVSHDFNNFLTPITGFALLGRDAPTTDDNTRAYFEQIIRSAEQAHNLSNQLVQMSGKGSTEPQVIDLNKSVSDMSALVTTIIGRTIELKIELDEQPQVIHVDPARLQQVLMNLIVNAKDAMPNRGSLTLSTKRNGDDNLVRLSVTDTGVGMTDEVKARLFEPFFTTKPPGKGTGLGLATCYQIIKECNGRIAVDSQPGKGTSFQIFIPRYSD